MAARRRRRAEIPARAAPLPQLQHGVVSLQQCRRRRRLGGAADDFCDRV